MMNKIFIHTNNKQGLGATLAKYAIKRKLPKDSPVKVEILNVDNLPLFKSFAGKTYLRGGREVTYDPNDLQSFTLSRFMPPELMGYAGRSVVIDPDIFALKDITPLVTMDLEGKPLAACRKKDAWDTSVMVMDNEKLRHWKMEDFLSALEKRGADYGDIMSLKLEKDIKELPRIWNSLDTLTEETCMLHTTNRLTQPWKTGLPIDFRRNAMPKILGLIPREPIYKLLGKYPTHYQRHPNPAIEAFFFELVREALDAGAVTRREIEVEIEKGHVRSDLLKRL